MPSSTVALGVIVDDNVIRVGGGYDMRSPSTVVQRVVSEGTFRRKKAAGHNPFGLFMCETR